MEKGETYIGFWWKNLRERDHFGDPGVDGTIILKCTFGIRDLGVWTGYSSQYTDSWWAHVNAGIIFRVP
jgi:hypothetical protein